MQHMGVPHALFCLRLAWVVVLGIRATSTAAAEAMLHLRDACPGRKTGSHSRDWRPPFLAVETKLRGGQTSQLCMPLPEQLSTHTPPAPILAGALPFLDLARQYAILALTGGVSKVVHTTLGPVHAIDVKGTGSLPPVILLHGMTASVADYRLLITRLAKSCRRVIAVDMPGHGHTPLPTTSTGALVPPSGKIMLSAVAECLDELVGAQPVFLWGNSLGGLVAIRAAQLLPEGRVLGLILASPGGAPHTDKELEGLKALFRLHTHQSGLDLVDRITPSREFSPKRHMLGWALRARAARPSVQALLGAISGDDLLAPQDLQGINVPVLLIWGQQERIFDAEKLKFFLDNLPGHLTTLERPAHCGHVPFLDQPNKVAAMTTQFMRRSLPA